MSATAGAGARGGPVTYELATWGVRAAAYLIDLLVVASLGIAIGIGAYVAEGGDGDEARKTAETLVYAIGIPVSLAYAPLLLMRRGERNGQTLGKQAMRIRVVRENGAAVTLGNGVMREVIGRQLLVAFTYGLYAVLDYLWPLWDRSRQCLHDKVAQTRVVRVAPAAVGAASTAGLFAPPPVEAHAPAPPSQPEREPVPPAPAPAPAPPRDDAPVRDGWLPPRAGR